MKIIVAVTAGFVGVAATPAFACHTDPFSFKFGSDASAHATVRAGERCRLGFMIKSRSHMDAAALVQGPQHGTLTQADATHWFYQPARGYAGPDGFVTRANGTFMGNRGTREGDANITWALDVSP